MRLSYSCKFFFFFFESEFIFRCAYNSVQRRSRGRDVLCLGVCVERRSQGWLAMGSERFVGTGGLVCACKTLETSPGSVCFYASVQFPSRPRFSAGTSLLQEAEHRLSVLRLREELREGTGAAISSEVLVARGGV